MVFGLVCKGHKNYIHECDPKLSDASGCCCYDVRWMNIIFSSSPFHTENIYVGFASSFEAITILLPFLWATSLQVNEGEST